ncbi:SET domain-containing protein [Streptomyces rochei]|uniref:SET domain-containing protein n=1 Tax=Streptomyces rochei TaxID=1928 RepID=UPI0027DD4743|nr:SET domain-containing protein [Streptomyces rochei]WMI61321.1 SET domain-containing protein [Streptomyces rochei]
MNVPHAAASGPGHLRIGVSAVHGRGVFATRALTAGETVESCPVILVPASQRHLVDDTALYDYYFDWPGGQAALALGYGSLYNHSPRPNARYRKNTDALTVDIHAVRAIAPGQEITVDYTCDGTNPLWFDPVP